jgi:hypothetical protein
MKTAAFASGKIERTPTILPDISGASSTSQKRVTTLSAYPKVGAAATRLVGNPRVRGIGREYRNGLIAQT